MKKHIATLAILWTLVGTGPVPHAPYPTNNNETFSIVAMCIPAAWFVWCGVHFKAEANQDGGKATASVNF